MLWPVATEALKKFLVIFPSLLGLFLDFLQHLLIVKVQVWAGTPGQTHHDKSNFCDTKHSVLLKVFWNIYFEALVRISTSNGS